MKLNLDKKNYQNIEIFRFQFASYYLCITKFDQKRSHQITDEYLPRLRVPKFPK